MSGREKRRRGEGGKYGEGMRKEGEGRCALEK